MNARLSSAASLIPLLAGCAVTLDMASHQPAHPIHEDVILDAKASGGVDRIELWMTEYAIKTDGSMNASGPAAMIKSCDPPFWKSSLKCSATKLLDSDQVLMVYEARAFGVIGDKDSEAYGFASGQYHHPGNDEFPKKEDPIPIRINSHEIHDFLDIAMVPDPDLLDSGPEEFRSQLHEVIAMYFQYDAIREARGLFNFYYSPFSGHFYEDEQGNCGWDLPDNMPELEDVADVVLFLHEANLQDCSQGMMISSEIDYDKTLVHESGHGLFGLNDEYRICDGGYYPYQKDQECKRNIWRNSDHDGNGKWACENDVPEGLEASDCTYIIPPGQVWRIDPADVEDLEWSNAECYYVNLSPDDHRSGCIMGDLQHQKPSDFGPACLRRIDFRYELCLDGECMPADECL